MPDKQAKYRKYLLLLLPLLGIMIMGQGLIQYEWNVIRLALFLFFVLFFAYRVVVLIRER